MTGPIRFALAGLMWGASLGQASHLAGQEAPIVTTSGWGEASVAPDRAVINIGVETHLPTASEASDSLAILLEMIRRDLAEAGVSRDSVTTTYFAVTPVFRNTQDGRRLANGYRASMQLEAPVNDLSGLGPVIDAVVSTAGTSLSGVTFESTRQDDVRATAIAQAFLRARADAASLAAAAGMALGDLIELTTEGPATMPVRSFAMERMQSAPELSPQEIVVGVQVTGRWRLQRQH